MKSLLILMMCSMMMTACGEAIGTAPESNGQGFTQGDRPTANELEKLKSEFVPQIRDDGADNRWSSALFGIFHEMFAVKQTVELQELLVTTPYLTKAPLRVRIHKSASAKAPLAIVLNPLYSGDFQNQMLRFIEYYIAHGYHVIVMPNTWAPEYLENGPTFFPGDMATEGRMHVELLDQIVASEFKRENILGTTLVGMSYGAFMSAVVKAEDEKRARPLIDGPTLIVNPPHDMINSLRNIDKQTTEVGWIDGGKCLINGGLIGFIQAIRKIDNYNDADLDEKCAKYLLTTIGFNVTLKYSIGMLNSSKKLGLSLPEVAGMTYERYVLEVAKIPQSEVVSDLGRWMSEAAKAGYDGFLVVISQDDTINEGNDLATNKYFKFTPANLMVLPTGGHTGFREARSTNPACAANWMMCLLDTLYK